jgi:hypothetical protein
VQRLLIPSDGLNIPAFLVRSPMEKGVVLALDDDGKEALAADPVVGQFLEAGWSVCGVDPRGIGEMAVLQKGWLAVVNLLLGDNLVLLQARDLGRAGAVFRGKPIAVYARGNNAALAAMYLIPNQDGLKWYILRDGFVSFRQFIDRPKSLEASYRLRGGDGRNMWFDREIPLGYFPFDALRSFDLPQLVRATSVPGLVVNPINGDWERMNGEEARGYVPAGLRVVSEDNPEAAIVRFVQ